MSLFRRSSLCFSLLLLSGISAIAGVTFFGNVGYSVNQQRTEVTIRLDGFESRFNGGNHRTIRFQLWATPGPWNTARPEGFVVGSFTYEVPGRALLRRENVVETVAFRALPAGNYFVTLTAEELISSRWLIRDVRNFSGPGPVSTGVTTTTVVPPPTPPPGQPGLPPGPQFDAFERVFRGGLVNLGRGWWSDPALGLLYNPNGGNWFHIHQINRWYFFVEPGSWEEGLWIFDRRYDSWAYSRRSWYPAVFFEREGRWRFTGFR
jgi:hypothetical protein